MGDLGARLGDLGNLGYLGRRIIHRLSTTLSVVSSGAPGTLSVLSATQPCWQELIGLICHIGLIGLICCGQIQFDAEAVLFWLLVRQICPSER